MNLGDRGVNIVILTVIIVIATVSAGALSLIHPVEAQQENSSVYLSLEPKEIRVPYMENEITDLILVELKIYNVSNLKEFHYELGYDSNVISYFSGSMDSHFFASSGGWKGGAFNGTLAGSFSGSSTMFIYAFKVRQTGSTTIELIESGLIDEDGNPIPHNISGTTVEIVSFDNWVNGKYAKLKGKFDQLNENFAELKVSYENLSAEYSSLIENHASLEERYENLSADYESLNDNYQDLLSEISRQSSEIESLNNRVLAWQIGTVVAGLIAALVVIFYIFKLGRTEG